MSDESLLAKKEEELFSNTYTEKQEPSRFKLSSREVTLPTSWGGDMHASDNKPLAPVKRSLGVAFFLISFLVLILAGGFVAWKFLKKSNVVSAANIDIKLDMKPYIEGGEKVPLSYVIQNKNTLPLLNATLLITYEKGIGAQEEQDKVREKIELGTIAPGQVNKGEVQVELYGAENTSRILEARLDYKVNGSNAPFNKSVTTTATLKTPPVSVNIDIPDSASPGQAISLSVRVKNNTTATNTVLMALSLPTLFTLSQSTPAPLTRTTTWKMENLLPGEERKIELEGSYKGSPGEKVSFKALVGGEGTQSNDIGNVYSSDVKEMAIVSSGLTAKLVMNHETGGAASTFIKGEKVQGLITYSNDSGSSLDAVQLVLTFAGIPIDPKTVGVSDGLYDSQKGTIIWNLGTTDALKILEPGEKGTVSFTFLIPVDTQPNASVSFRVKADADIAGGNTHLASEENKKWFVEGGATFSGSVMYGSGPFVNSGPLPPTANKVTTYTITLLIGAPNGVKSGKVSMLLPLYVTWLNKVYLEAPVSYDARTRVVTWNMGDVTPNELAKVSFQVSVKPSETHIGTTPPITSGITFDGMDSSSGTSLKRTLDPLTTEVGDRSTKDLSTVVSEN